MGPENHVAVEREKLNMQKQRGLPVILTEELQSLGELIGQ